MIVTAIDLSHGLEGILNSLMTQGAALGWTLIKAFLVFIVGRLLINLVNKLIKRVLLKRDIDPSVKSFVGSLVNVVLAQGTGGTVKEIQIFHTILSTPDNKMVYIPNGSLSSGAVTNFSRQTTRRVDWTFGVDYGEDYDKVKEVIQTILARDSRILADPAPFIALHALADSSVNIVVRVWVESPNDWNVYFGINQEVYATFNEKGINFPFPQLTVHRADN